MKLKRICGALLPTLLLLAVLSGCGRAGDVSEVKLDYGTSHVFMRQEVDDAARMIMGEFKSWKGCKLYSLRYVGDSCNNEENVRKMNVLQPEPGFDQHIEFVSKVRASKSPPKKTELEPGREYDNWHWHLARGKEQEWYLVSWGEK